MRRLLPHSLLSISLILLTPCIQAQDIPIGTWRSHISYNAIRDIAFTKTSKVYAAASNGVMVVDGSDNSVSSFNKINGLSGSGITSIAFDDKRDQLLIAYQDGNLDILRGNEMINFDRLKNSTTIVGSKRLNAIEVNADLAYISADFGVVVFDLQRLEVKETWRDLGAGGVTLKIIHSAFLDDTIFLATEKGVMAGNLNDNLLDFNLWNRFDQGELNAPVESIAAFNGFAYAAINGSGIHRYETGEWTKEPFLQGSDFQSLEASENNLVIAEGANLWELNAGNSLDQIVLAITELPLTAKEDKNGILWIGDTEHGLISNMSGDFLSIIPNGPSATFAYRLKYADNKLYAMEGGKTITGLPLRNPGGLSAFENGVWTTSVHPVMDLMDIEVTSAQTFLASFGYGLEKTDATITTLYDESNSPLVNLNPPGRFVDIPALEFSNDGLWVANYGTAQSLKLLKDDNTWESFSFPVMASRYPIDLVLDGYGYLWMVLDPSQGGGILVYDHSENRYAYLTDVTGSGGLPSKAVRSIAVDRDNYVWVGTDEGVAYFIYPPDVFESGINAIKPIYESRFLLKDDRVTAIAVDGGNRKWMGTERGVWLFNPSGETQVYNFTAANSPLLSDIVQDVEIDPASGEVFFATSEGVISFRSGATASESFFQSVKIFPNPVTTAFTGMVGISGLATDAIVKITDVSGKLIWQTQAQGGTATWNVQDYRGRRAVTGIYLVFAATADGSETIVGKVAVVD